VHTQLVSFKRLMHSLCTRLQVTITMAHSPCFFSPLADSPWSPLAPLFYFSTPFYLLGTLLAVTGSIHLGLRLLVNWPPLSQPFPLQIPRTPITLHLTKTTSGTIRRLLSGNVHPWCSETLKISFAHDNLLRYVVRNSANILLVR
jgi:hypothetical protein